MDFSGLKTAFFQKTDYFTAKFYLNGEGNFLSRIVSLISKRSSFLIQKIYDLAHSILPTQSNFWTSREVSSTQENNRNRNTTRPSTDLVSRAQTSNGQSYFDYFIEKGHKLYPESEFRSKFHMIGECLCKPIDFRNKLEDATIKLVTETFKDKTKSFTVVSVGSGGAFQELVFTSKLLKQGFENINLILIDPIYEQQKIMKELEEFKEKYFENRNVNFTLYNKLSEYISDTKRNNESIQLFLLIDLDGDENIHVLSEIIKETLENHVIPENAVCSYYKTIKHGAYRIENQGICGNFQKNSQSQISLDQNLREPIVAVSHYPNR